MPSVTSTSDLERQLKLVTKTGKFIVGRKEVAGSLKGSKLLVWSASANLPMDLIDQCRNLQIPTIRFEGNAIELGRIAGIPYKVSIISVKTPGDADLQSFSNAQDYLARQEAGAIPSSSPEEAPPSKVSASMTQASEKPKEGKTPTKKKKAKEPTEEEHQDEGEPKKIRKKTKTEREEEEEETQKSEDETPKVAKSKSSASDQKKKKKTTKKSENSSSSSKKQKRKTSKEEVEEEEADEE